MSHPKHRLTAISLALSSVLLLSACNSSNNAETSLVGTAFKGPIDNAQINVLSQDNTQLASGVSQNGKFTIPDLDNLPADQVIFIETLNGQYTDEATGETVTPTNTGLMTAFTAAELQKVMNNKEVLAITPETTIMARLVKKFLAAGKSPAQAIADAKATVEQQLIDGTSPVGGVSEGLLLTGDLTTAIPADQFEALARNRAISFSYDAQSKNLRPDQVFDMISATATDLEDGALDGKDVDGNTLTLVDKDNNPIDLSKVDRKTDYGLARTRLLNNTINRFASGNASEEEKAELEKMGIDTSYFDQLAQANADAEAQTQANLAATNLPAFNFLPVLTDEDGDATNNAATYTLTATPDVNVTINAPGASWTTPMLRYNGMQLPPVIEANRNDAMTLNLVNDLTEETTIHWHGFKIPGDQDGGPDFPVAANGGKTYSFPMLQPAASLWFHPHPDMKTGEQVYRGLAGVFLLKDAISDQLEASNELPSGNYDIPMLIQDRRFADEVNGVRELEYRNLPMDADGMLGSDILVNGAILPKLDVETRQYRLRIYNTSNARTYNFALSDGASFTVVGTDGGLLPEPVTVTELMLGAAERAEIVIDFGNYNVGDKVMLISKAFAGSNMMAMDGMNMDGNMDGMNGGMGGMNGGSGGNSMPGNGGNTGGMGGNTGGMTGGNMGAVDLTDMAINGRRMDVMRFDITTQVTDPVTLYTALPATAEINTQRLQASDADKVRDFVLTMAMGDMNGGGMNGGNNGGMAGMSFLINGKSFDINRIDEVVNLADGDTEIWSIQNMSPMAHPFHVHAIQWQVLDRNGVPASGVDLGWKDTVLVQPGETVRIIGRFDPLVNYGDYMYHCHILEHEDDGMMGFFKITNQ